MDLINIRKVSLDYGISRRMLCYYEEIGLIKSSRKEDYAYRVYDDDAIKRIRQIIILRKLQIPMKQIKDILNNPIAIKIIEIFEQNIKELDEQITALSTVKSILVRFVDELQEKADVHLKLDLLNDKSMLAVVNTLPFSENKINNVKEKVTMEELNTASETLGKLESDKFRVMLMPPTNLATVEYDRLGLGDGLTCPERSKAVIDAMKKFVDDAGLFDIKPDARFFGELWHDGHTEGNYQLSVTIPNDMDVPAPLKRDNFNGGLYVTGKGEDTWNFLENNPNYEWAPAVGPITHEYYNLWNRLGLKYGYYDDIGFSYLELIIHIKQIKTLTNAEKEKIEKSIKKSVLSGTTENIDLTTLINKDAEASYADGVLSIKSNNDFKNGMLTPKKYKLPLKINLRAKTDETDIILRFGEGCFCLNHKYMRGMVCINDPTSGEPFFYNCTEVPPDEFADIEWILAREAMILKVNGETRHFTPNYHYIEAFEADPGYEMFSEITVKSFGGSTITVESLRVTEM